MHVNLDRFRIAHYERGQPHLRNVGASVFDVKVVAFDDALHIVAVALRHVTGIDRDVRWDWLQIDGGFHNPIDFHRFAVQIAQHPFDDDGQTLAARIDDAGLFQDFQLIGRVSDSLVSVDHHAI